MLFQTVWQAFENSTAYKKSACRYQLSYFRVLEWELSYAGD